MFIGVNEFVHGVEILLVGSMETGWGNYMGTNVILGNSLQI